MKNLILLPIFLTLLSSLASVPASACECGEHAMAGETAIGRYLEKNYGTAILKEEIVIEATRYYSGLYEKLFHEQPQGGNCWWAGPNQEPMYQCTTSRKEEFKVKLVDRGCELRVRTYTDARDYKLRVLSKKCD